MVTNHYDVFLSHNSADKLAVEILAQQLVKAGLNPWLDKWNLIPGVAWQPALEEALAACATCAVFIGPKGSGAWQNEEMRAAINRRVGDHNNGFRVIPVLLPGAERGERSKLPTFLTTTTWVEFRSGLDDEDAFHRLVCGIRGVEPGPTPSEAVYANITPYRGLQIFGVKDYPFFFGREALVEWLLDDLRPDKQLKPGNRFLGIIGPSGSGKSSLAQAGLAAALKQGKIGGSNEWPLVICKPGNDPLENLAIAVNAVTGDGPKLTAVRSLIRDFSEDPRTLHLVTRLTLHDAPAERRLVVLIDQFEEIFTLCHDDAMRKATIDTLLHAAMEVGGQTIVILTLRADFYGKCAAYPNLAAALSDHQMLVEAMSRDELRQAIEQPALLSGYQFDPGLVETLLNDVENQPGGLPLLQDALFELWNRRAGSSLTHAAYLKIGGIKGALEQRAEDVYATFNATEQAICRRIFLRLTQPGEGTEDTRRRATIRELRPSPEQTATFETVLGTLTGPKARLITAQSDLGHSDQEGDTSHQDDQVVEVAHEALIRSWSRLRNWIDEDRAALRTHRQLTEDAADWIANAHDASYLYMGSRLDDVIGWAAKHADDLNEEEESFLNEGVAVRAARERADQRQLRWTIGSLIAALLIISTAAITAFVFYRNAKDSENSIRAQLLVSEGQRIAEERPLLGLQLMLEGIAGATRDAQNVRDTRTQALAQVARRGRIAQLSTSSDEIIPFPDGSLFILARNGEKAELRHTDDGSVVAELSGELAAYVTGFNPDEDPFSNVVQFSPDGNLFVVDYEDGTKELRRTDNTSAINLDTVDSVDFSHDSQFCILVFEDQHSELWRIADWQRIKQLRPRTVSVDPNENGQTFELTYQLEPSANTANQSEPTEAKSDEMITEVRQLVDGDVVAPDMARTEQFAAPMGSAHIVNRAGAKVELYQHDGDPPILLAGTVEHAYFSPNGAVLVVDYVAEQDELRWLNDRPPLKLGGEVNFALFNTNSTDLIVHLGQSPNEQVAQWRNADTGNVVWSSPSFYYSFEDGEVFYTNFISFDQTGDVVVLFDGNTAEFRRTHDGTRIGEPAEALSTISLSPKATVLVAYLEGMGRHLPTSFYKITTGTQINGMPRDYVTNYNISQDETTLYVNYEETSDQIWNVQGTPYLLTNLGPETTTVFFDSAARHVIVKYRDGQVDLIDLKWLRAMQGDPAKLSPEELIRISCQAVHESGLWTAADDQALKQALGGREPQACK